MSDPSAGLRPFLAELKRRRVFRVALVYAVVGFVVWQVGELAVPGLALPDWVFRLIVLLTILGFPIALVLAWAYDITPAGVRRTRPDKAEPAEAPTSTASSVADTVERKSIVGCVSASKKSAP